MSRQSGLDSPGTLRYVIVRGIEKSYIVEDKLERKVLVSRPGSLPAEAARHLAGVTVSVGQKLLRGPN